MPPKTSKHDADEITVVQIRRPTRTKLHKLKRFDEQKGRMESLADVLDRLVENANA